MNKKEKEILEKRVLESELECLEAEEDMKSDKRKQARMLAMEKKMAAKEAAHICQLLLPDTNIFQIKMDAMEKFKLTKGM